MTLFWHMPAVGFSLLKTCPIVSSASEKHGNNQDGYKPANVVVVVVVVFIQTCGHKTK